MTSERGRQAAARAAAAGRRAAQLRRRAAQLREGVPSTPEDVVLAQLAAEDQRAEAHRARERLRQVFSEAASLSPAVSAPTAPASAPGADAGDTVGARADPGSEHRVLRHALVSIASSGEWQGGWPRERRQQLWQALVERCGSESWQGWSHALCVTASSLLPGVRGIALSGFSEGGVPHLLAVSDGWTRRMEEVLQLVGEGPAVDAHRSQAPVGVRDLTEAQPRWPVYALAAAEAGLRSVYALPVQVDGVALGALTLYPDDQDGSAWYGWTDGLHLAAVASRTLLVDLDAMEEGYEPGDRTDDQVPVATGVLSVRLDVTVAEASARMRAYAFSHARGLDEVARAVLDGSLELS